MLSFTSASEEAVVTAVELLSTKWPSCTCMASGFGMMAMESPAFACKVFSDKKAAKQKRRNERLVKGLFLQKIFFIQNGFVCEKLR